MRISYLGPEGTFTEAALLGLPTSLTGQAVTAVAEESVPAALDAVRAGRSDRALVPLESSVEGSVPLTLDELASGEPVRIVGEAVLGVRFALLARPGEPLADLQVAGPGCLVSGHPHAWPQCRRWLARHLPDARFEPSASNADAARRVAAGEVTAALAGAFAAPRYGLTVAADTVSDNPTAETRFVLLGPPGPPPAPTGADKTTLVAFERDDHPGALLEILTEFAVRGVNLVRLESRPTGAGLGRYCFSIDCEGHVAEARVGEALSALWRVCADVRFLGSYPRADGRPVTVRAGTADPDFTGAAHWLNGLRTGSEAGGGGGAAPA